jgi:hypothetical protein
MRAAGELCGKLCANSPAADKKAVLARLPSTVVNEETPAYFKHLGMGSRVSSAGAG